MSSEGENNLSNNTPSTSAVNDDTATMIESATVMDVEEIDDTALQEAELLGTFGFFEGDSVDVGQSPDDSREAADIYHSPEDSMVVPDDDDFDSDSGSEEQQNLPGEGEDEIISKAKETELTNKFLNGELTFSEYAVLMEGSEAEEGEPDPSTSVAAAELEKEMVAASTLRSKKPKPLREGCLKRRPRRALPLALLGLMGEANLRYARGERESAVKMCLEIIRQVPTAPEPFHTLAVLYDELGAPDKSLQFALIAAHLSPNDPDQWIRLAVMSEEQGNMKQAITCYTKAINADRSNIDLHVKRATMLEKIGDRKEALKCYMRLLNILTPEDGVVILKVAKMTAHKYHEDGELIKAREAMEVAFTKSLKHITSEDVNLMLELLLALEQYARSLEILVQHCNIEVEAEFRESQSIEGAVVEELHVLAYTLPDKLAIDLHTKFAVVLIHLKAFHLIDTLVKPFLEGLDPEEAGDLFLDVAEALMFEDRYEEALTLLTPLVQSDNFSLAAVWLRQAECLQACERLQEAAKAYQVVVDMAPQHLEARLTLSALLQELGQGDGALAVLVQDAESEVLEPGLLYKRCMLLKGSKGRTDEYLTVGQLLLSRHCVRVRNRDELHALTRMRRLDRKNLALMEIRKSRGESQQDTDAPDFEERENNSPTIDQEYELLRDMCSVCLQSGRHALLQRLAFSALGSRLFHFDADRIREIEFLCLLSCLYNGDAYYGYNLARDALLKNLSPNRVWNLFNLVIQRADDVRHNRFLMRLMTRHPNHEALIILHANNCLVAGTYKYALSDYAHAYRTNPSPLLAFLLAVTFFQMACQKFSAKKHSLVTQGLSFMWKYQQLRGNDGYHESCYNMGRAFHQLGLLPAAIHHYKKVLSFETELTKEHPHILNLQREAAFNLHLIYMNSGARDLARSYIDKYLVI